MFNPKFQPTSWCIQINSCLETVAKYLLGMRREQHLLWTKQFQTIDDANLCALYQPKPPRIHESHHAFVVLSPADAFLIIISRKISLANHDRTSYIVYFPWQSSHLAVYVGIWLLLNLGCTWDRRAWMVWWDGTSSKCFVKFLSLCYESHSSQLTAHTTATTQKEVFFFVSSTLFSSMSWEVVIDDDAGDFKFSKQVCIWDEWFEWVIFPTIRRRLERSFRCCADHRDDDL